MRTNTRVLLIFLGIWTVINLVQGGLAELAEDEAYYWMWSQHLAIGYFDHPPMVAVFIRLGYTLFQSELGVRLMTILSSTAVLYLLYRMTGPERLNTLILIAISTLFVHVGAMIVAPDTALIFFITLFFFLWKQYLERDSWGTAAILMVVVALVMYSKYHGVFALFFTVIANPRIWRRPSFWLIIIGSVALYLPHLLWLFGDGLASLEYNSEKRMTNAWNINEVLNYVGAQLVFAGPLVGFITFYAAFRQKAVDPFTRAMKSAMIGVFGVFFLLSLRGHVEANWTASGYIPLIYLSTVFVNDHTRVLKWLRILAIPSVILILIVRLHIITGFLPIEPRIDKSQEFRGWKEYTELCLEAAGDRPLAAHRFQDASKHSFYSGQLVPSLGLNTREDQFTFWRFDTLLEGQDIAYVTTNQPGGIDTVAHPAARSAYIYTLDDFRAYSDVEINCRADTITMSPGSSTTVFVDITSPGRWEGPAKGHRVALGHFFENNSSNEDKESRFTDLPEGVFGEQTIRVRITAPPKPGGYRVFMFLSPEAFPAADLREVSYLVVE